VKCYLVGLMLILPQTMPAQSTHVRELVSALQEPARAQAASDELRQLALASAKNMKETEVELAGALKVRSDVVAFKREADLARELKLSSLAPVLAQSLEEDTRDKYRIGTLSHINGPDFDPAMKALVSFGSTSIAPLVEELNVGNRLGRYRAAYTLAAIGGPEVNAAMRDRYYKEADAGLKNYLGYKSDLLNGRM